MMATMQSGEVANKLMTADEFVATQREGWHELVRGKVIEMPPPGDEHGVVCNGISFCLTNWAKKNGFRVFGNDTGVVTRTNPDTVRGPDISVASKEHKLTGKALRVGPKLIAEVLSPSNTRAQILMKVGELFGVGVEEAWVFDPKSREAEVFRPDEPVRRVLADGLFETDILPGFSVPLAACFEDLDD